VLGTIAHVRHDDSKWHADVGTGSVPAASHHGCLCRCHGTPATIGEPQPVRTREEGL